MSVPHCAIEKLYCEAADIVPIWQRKHEISNGKITQSETNMVTLVKWHFCLSWVDVLYGRGTWAWQDISKTCKATSGNISTFWEMCAFTFWFRVKWEDLLRLLWLFINCKHWNNPWFFPLFVQNNTVWKVEELQRCRFQFVPFSSPSAARSSHPSSPHKANISFPQNVKSFTLILKIFFWHYILIAHLISRKEFLIITTLITHPNLFVDFGSCDSRLAIQ